MKKNPIKISKKYFLDRWIQNNMAEFKCNQLLNISYLKKEEVDVENFEFNYTKIFIINHQNMWINLKSI